MKQVVEAQKAEQEASLESGTPSTYSSEAPAVEETDDTDAGTGSGGGGGTLASDEALAALREKLTGDK